MSVTITMTKIIKESEGLQCRWHRFKKNSNDDDYDDKTMKIKSMMKMMRVNYFKVTMMNMYWRETKYLEVQVFLSIYIDSYPLVWLYINIFWRYVGLTPQCVEYWYMHIVLFVILSQMYLFLTDSYPSLVYNMSSSLV